MLLLDTHALLWAVTANPALGARARAALAKAFAEATVGVSVISFWEVAMLSARGRIEIVGELSMWRAQVLKIGIREIPITGDIAIAAGALDGVHGDPADRFIIATASEHGAALLTADRQILRWPSRLPRIDARR